MEPIPAELRPGRIVSSPVLHATGYDKSDVRKAARQGILCPIRRGWYHLGNPDPSALRAVRSGGVLSCVSALAFHGVWTPPEADLHVGFSEFGDLGRREKPGFLRCSPPGQRPTPALAVDGVELALAAASRCVSAETMLVLLESAINLHLVDRADLHHVLLHCPPKMIDLIAVCRASESGTETMVRDRLRRRRIAVRSQVQIGDIGRVDLLVGRQLVIEVDSVAHHTDLVSYQRDRLRDLRLVALGFQVVRLTYEQVMFGWPEVEDHLLHLTRRRDHRRRPRGKA